ncbi:MAG: L-histidine N(alpha)-methyltransferase [Ardenticatenaceae bacterium]
MITQRVLSGVNLIEVPVSSPEQSFSSAVAEGLSKSQKTLPCRFFYDAVGSELFEQICDLPEYYPTRTEQQILERYASDMIEALDNEVVLVEFGSGSSFKTRILMNALLARQGHLDYTPIDISSDFLLDSSLTLLSEYERLSITAIAAEYNEALRVLPELHAQPRLFIFLGSNIGNFGQQEAVALLAKMAHQMRAEDRLLIGFDLVKDRDILFAAYNDAAGVTAAFNKNLLARINRELGGNFDLDQFTHYAPFVEEPARIDVRLVSQRHQSVYIEALEQSFEFEEGEYIHTENSHKYTPESFAVLCDAAGLAIQEEWVDERTWFEMALLRRT